MLSSSSSPSVSQVDSPLGSALCRVRRLHAYADATKAEELAAKMRFAFQTSKHSSEGDDEYSQCTKLSISQETLDSLHVCQEEHPGHATDGATFKTISEDDDKALVLPILSKRRTGVFMGPSQAFELREALAIKSFSGISNASTRGPSQLELDALNQEASDSEDAEVAEIVSLGFAFAESPKGLKRQSSSPGSPMRGGA